MRIYSDENVIVNYYSHGCNTINIAFSGYTSMADRRPFGYESHLNMNQDCLIVTALKNHYYHYDLDNLIISLKEIARKYKKICLLGFGMGAYAAIKISKILNANTVIACSPLIGDTYENNPESSKSFAINKDEVGGEVFVLSDNKANRDKKNIDFLRDIIKLNYYNLPDAGHICFAALSELKLINFLFMGRGEVELTKFFLQKLKDIYEKDGIYSTTVFCNIFTKINDIEKKLLIEKYEFNKLKISNANSDKYHQIVSNFLKDKDEAHYVYSEAINSEKLNTDLCKKLYIKAISFKNSCVYWKFQLARFLQKNNQTDDALQYYIEAINEALTDSVYYVFVADWSNRVALIYEKQGKRNEARKYFALSQANDTQIFPSQESRFTYNSNEFDQTKKITQFISDILPMCKKNLSSENKQNIVSRDVFVYWGQGFDKAPELVKKCLSSIKKYTCDLNLVLLNDSNIDNYIEVPNHIKEKFLQGKIKHAHYSDILRLMLLKKHGGCWIDATCLVTSKISDQIDALLKESNFFAFMYEKPMISNWFLVSKQDSYIVSMMLEALLEYWNSFLGHSYYFCFHSIFYSLYLLDEKFKNEVDKGVYFSTKIPHNLQVNMLNKYDELRFKEMINKCFLHKLTYKFDSKKLQDSNLEKILNLN